MFFRAAKLVAGASGAFLAFHLLLAAALAAGRRLRQAARTEPEEDYPWVEPPEAELEDGEALKLYTEGERLYEAMLAEIERARSHIFLGSFVWKGDDAGEDFVEALSRKASEGVRVRSVFDRMGNAMTGSLPEDLPDGIHNMCFRPSLWATPLKAWRAAIRYHRHEMSVDGEVAFLGGYNIGRPYKRWWRDTQVRVRGAAARAVDDSFAEFWNAHRTPDLPELERHDSLPKSPAITLHCNDPRGRAFPIRRMYLRALDRAASHAYITQGYFIPTRDLRRHLIGAAGRGVDVRILLPAECNHVMVDWLGRRHFDELLRNGVRIFAYKRFMHHAKTATIDGLWSTVGTANLNRQSLRVHHEANLEIHSKSAAARMEDIFECDVTNAEEITLENWRGRPFSHQAVERALDTLRPIL